MNEKSSAQISARFKEERERLGMTQQEMAVLGGSSLRTMQGYESGSFPPKTEFLASVAPAGVDICYVVTGVRNAHDISHKLPKGDAQFVAVEKLDFPPKTHNLSGAAPAPVTDEDTIYVPLLSAAGSMGPGNELLTEDVILNDVPFSRRWLAMHLPRCRPAAIKLIHAYGDSMHGTLESGDFALVDTDAVEVLVDGVYVLEAHSRLFIKRVRQRLDGRFEVSSDNEAIKTSDILDGTQQVCVKGRVVYGWNGRRF
ncbi:XRE family transcriptional regulator [Comamonas thiooxydans]|uniref:XRE family transcriptional regulator n=1 Tax=Comamonas thiooxydans TaxID=363952 RepID=UPI002113D164|nr:XRE family transcriptional regulator [Comamonas thiooxydans]UUE94848.1 peptidase S24 [Comamonas thiooxydans]